MPIARINTGEKEIPVENNARDSLQYGHADLLGSTGEHRRFIDHQIPLLKHSADHLAGILQVGQIRAVMPVDGCRYRDDIDVAVREVFRAAGETELSGLGKLGLLDF